MKKIILLSIFLTFVLKIYIIYNSQLTFYSDDAIYAEIARFWLQRKFSLVFHPTWPPLYPFLTFVVNNLLDSWENSARVVSALAGSALILPLYLIGRKFLPTSAAFLFSLSVILVGPIFKISILAQSDMLATMLVVSAITLFIYKRFYLASIVFGLTYLTRSEGLMFFGLSLVFLVFIKKIKTIPMFLIIFLVTISPYLIALKLQTGSFSLSQKASAQIKQGHAFQLVKGTTWIQEVVSVKRPNYKSDYFKGGLKHVLEYSDWFWFWTIQKANVWKGVLIKNIPTWALLLSVVGITTLLKRHSWETFYVIFLTIPAVALTIFATPLADVRYLLWVFPIIIGSMYAGVRSIFYFFTKNKKGVVFIPAGILLIFMLPVSDMQVFLNPKDYAQNFTNTYSRPEIEKAGLWIKENTKKENPRIMARHEGIEFYADGQTVYIPQELTLAVTLEYAKKNKVDYFTASSDQLANDKNLSPLLGENFQSKTLKKVFVSEANERIIVIYETSFERL